MALAVSYEDILLKNGSGIPGVHVALYNLNNVKVAATTTEGVIIEGDNKVNGKYAFSGIDPGQYEVRFFGEGFTSNDNKTINIAGDSVKLDKWLLLQSLVERESALVWASRGLFDIFTDTTSVVRDISSLTAEISNDSLHLPSTSPSNSSFIYETTNLETSVSGATISGMDIATMYADYTQGEGQVKIESTFDNSSYYTWLDTSAGVNRLGQEKTNSDFANGTTMKVKVTLTAGADGTGSQVNHIALYTGPDLFT